MADFLCRMDPPRALGNANGSLKSETRGSTVRVGGRHLRAWLVTSEVALVMVLLTGAVLLIQSFRYLNEVNPGFQPKHLVALDLSIGGSSYTNDLRRNSVFGSTFDPALGIAGSGIVSRSGRVASGCRSRKHGYCADEHRRNSTGHT